ncbi:helix-turn-helix domain-containing protein [Vagococcus hydrophili]|uniref:Helix-turn-helix transcriptional regulator n=1 Tax=Vagococcus hydrophili TaxID=2714947 RepID=A0A6G8ASC1_9ENTE|nr:helix-turn-helix transcriptional regulator [Vagococcus hydrophili]QIL47964.1 helix-turn-helix transcriptional regulator [Vagococcus hydrophili]
MSGINDMIQELSQDKEFKEAYEQEQTKLDIAVQVMKLREELNMTQREMASLVGKPQSTIARIESGNMNPSIKILNEIAERSGKKLTLSFN